MIDIQHPEHRSCHKAGSALRLLAIRSRCPLDFNLGFDNRRVGLLAEAFGTAPRPGQQSIGGDIHVWPVRFPGKPWPGALIAQQHPVRALIEVLALAHLTPCV